MKEKIANAESIKVVGIIKQNDPDMPIVRANDIVYYLNDENESPYYKLIKIPGTPRGAGCVDMSTIVSVLKDRFTENGVFARYRLMSLESQRATILNFFFICIILLKIFLNI